MIKKEEIDQLIEEEKFQEAMALLEENTPFQTIEMNFLLGEVYYKNQKWGKALNAFQEVLQLDAKHAQSLTYTDMIRSIIGFVNLEMLNP